MVGAVLLAVELHITTFDVGGAATSWVTVWVHSCSTFCAAAGADCLHVAPPVAALQ